MRRLLAAALAGLVFSPFAATAAGPGLTYPPAPKGPVTDTFFGTPVADPYRWMEELDSPQTTAWQTAENALARRYLDAIPQRAAILDHYRTMVNYERVSAPYHRGAHWFWSVNSGLQNQSVVYVKDREDGPGRVLLDPNTLSGDGTVALAGGGYPRDGTYFAYATQASGSDWQTWHVRDVASGRDLDDKLEWSKFSGASWRGDDGFYYSRYDAPAGGVVLSALGTQKLFYHKLGTPQSADRLIFTPGDPNQFIGASVSRDGRYLFMSVTRGTAPQNQLYVADLRASDTAFAPLFDKNDAQYNPIDNDGTRLYVLTTSAAPRRRVAWVDMNDATHALHDVVPEGLQPIAGISLLGNTLFVTRLTDAHTTIERYGLDGRDLGAMPLPGIGTTSAPGAERDETVAYYGFSSYTTPTTIYRYDVRTGASTVAIRPKVAFDPSRYETEQVFFTSKDGTKVPMFVTHRKGLVHDGTAPTILYGYGGFSISLLPAFSAGIATWLDMGGVYAVANLRGGDEYGEAWHLAGRLDKKQTVFDDFIAAAQYLIDRKYTSSKRLAISGASNGGLLVGACLVQRPDLFGAALPDVGVLDMLRFQRFTVGKAWTVEYGSAETSADQFKTLYAYSPLHNVKPQAYPPTLIRTADHDDRVFPAHSYKFAATLQAAQTGPAPILLAVESKAGHGAGKPITKQIEDLADEYAFLVRALDFTPSF